MSLEVNVVDAAGKKAGSVTLPTELFGGEVNLPLMHQVVNAQRAAARSGTHKTKTRGEVRGGGRKPYRQKGTGRARQGSIRAPQYAGGGTVHGPTPRDYSQRTPKKMKAAALRSALADRAAGERVYVTSGLIDSDTPKYKTAEAALRAAVEPRKVLAVVERSDETTRLSLRNNPDVHLLAPDQLNVYDVLVNDALLFTAGALETFVEFKLGADSDFSVRLDKKAAAKSAKSDDEDEEDAA